MTRNIDRVVTSEAFWRDLGALRKETWYPEIRKSISRFVAAVLNGDMTSERGFANPKLKGVYHVKLPRGQSLFHVYKEDAIHLCLVVDHKVYGFKGKHRSHEGRTAEKIMRISEMPNVVSPFWETIRWKEPSDLVQNPEVRELSIEGLTALLGELEKEAGTWIKLKQSCRVADVDDIPTEAFELWAEGLITAQDEALTAMEKAIMRRQVEAEPPQILGWASMGE